MKLEDTRSQIDQYFDNIIDEEFYQTLLKYMKKTIFEGTVNGTKFDNVQDYNNAITKALASGEPVNASSNTYTTDDITEADNAPGNDISLFPGFAHCSSLDSLNKEFIGAGLEIPEEEFEDSINQLFDEKIAPAVAKMNKAQAERYKTYVEGIMRYLGEIAGDYDQLGRQIDDSLTKLNEEIDKLAKKAQRAVDENRIVQSTATLYNNINELVSNRIETLNQYPTKIADYKDRVDSNGTCGRCDSDPHRCSGETNSYIEKVRKLVQTIFD